MGKKRAGQPGYEKRRGVDGRTVWSPVLADAPNRPTKQDLVEELPRIPLTGSRGRRFYSSAGQTVSLRMGLARSGSNHATVYADYELDENDMLLDLPGGLFVACAGDGKTYQARFTTPEPEPWGSRIAEDSLPGVSQEINPPSVLDFSDRHEDIIFEGKPDGAESWGIRSYKM